MGAEIQLNAIMAAVQRDDNSGFCISCGAEITSGIEPDARNVKCDVCGEDDVYGAEELLVMGIGK